MSDSKETSLKRDASAIHVISGPTYVADMDSLLSKYAEKIFKKKQRFKCSYPNCKRILMSEETMSFSCVTCGHGVMQPEEPRAHCGECGAPIYFNVDHTRDVTCGRCTSAKVESVERLEESFGDEIREFKKSQTNGNKNKKSEKSKDIIRNRGEYIFAQNLLKKKEEKKGSKNEESRSNQQASREA